MRFKSLCEKLINRGLGGMISEILRIPAPRPSVRLILQPRKGEVEILHKSRIPTGQTARGTQPRKDLQDR
ncbi:hypothetical protein BEL01nite_72240 [Bradyrhizobium elkanii]|nr:hypothetical protein BEL01nite_72240 [Bradyrhizobium elkanii]